MGRIGGLHHVGHVVRDIAAAGAVYRRMGFHVPPPAFPALPATPGAPPQAVGAGNTHVTLRRNFVELVTVADGAVPPDGSATLVPLDVPPGALDRVRTGIAESTARLRAALGRSEGVHILVLRTADADAAAERLSAAGVPHDGVQRLRRPGADGGSQPIGFLELDSAPGRSPEGRLALAEDLTGGGGVEHPNGAVDLVESILCVPDAELDDHVRRYERYLDRPARGTGAVRALHLDDDRVTIVAGSGLGAVLPGEPTPPGPAFVGYAVTVHELDATDRRLAAAGFPVRPTPGGDLFVPAAAALGTAVVFRRAR
jgi:hypothetical protein